MDVAFRTFALVAMAGSIATAATLVTHQTVSRMITAPQPAIGPAPVHRFTPLPQRRPAPQTITPPRQSVIRQVSFDDDASQRGGRSDASSERDRPLSRILGASSTSRYPLPNPPPDDDDDRRVVSPSEP